MLNSHLKGPNHSSRIALGVVALCSLMLSACSGQEELSDRQPPKCHLLASEVCGDIMEAGLHTGATPISDTARLENARVLPLVIPVSLPNGDLAAVIDCYVNTDLRSYSIVRARVAIPPRSPRAVEYLRDQQLCAE